MLFGIKALAICANLRSIPQALCAEQGSRSSLPINLGLVTMASLPDYRPKQLSLGPLEAEILNIIWDLGSATVKQVHDRILQDPDRELAYTSVTTVMQRLTQKGWLHCDKRERSFVWHPLISRDQAQALEAHDHLQRFLSVGHPDVVAAFADQLDQASIDQLEAIAARLRAARQARRR